MFMVKKKTDHSKKLIPTKVILSSHLSPPPRLIHKKQSLSALLAVSSNI